VFLDYDGTLTPIRDRPQDAVISGSTREAVRRLAERVPVVVVSSRDRQVVQQLMGLDHLPERRRRSLCQQIDLTDQEIETWKQMSRKMYVPFLADGVISQFEGWEDLEELDWGAYRRKYGNIQRLDRILRAEGKEPDRYKVAKQVDAVLLFYLFRQDELKQIFGPSAACPCMRLIAISSSTSPRRQANWQGAGQVRPRMYGKGNTSFTRRVASFIEPLAISSR
jgi:Glycosyl hydrolase family 65 central catalytic domain/Trehalose-phosphatase